MGDLPQRAADLPALIVAELSRLETEGVTVTMPVTVEDWGERAFQVRDPNGVIVQLVDWNGHRTPD